MQKTFFALILVASFIAISCSSAKENEYEVAGLSLSDSRDSTIDKDDTANTSNKKPFYYRPPYPNDSPWPCFRRDHRNSGNSPVRARYNAGMLPWSFRTGKGIFSTPVIDGNETAYVGSADKFFYAINSDGSERWRFACDELIDSAAALSPYNNELGCPTITVPSGDGYLYHLRSDDIEPGQERVLWKYNATQDVEGAGKCNWWEANVAMGFDGTYYAGNTNWNYYAINPDGTLKWVYPTGNIVWTAASFDDDGNIFWGSLDLFAHKVSPEGKNIWKKMTLMFVVSSLAIGSDGTVYLGSFDNSIYALDPATGKARWRYATNGHIYGSPALGEDENGETKAIYVTSTDGILYSLDTRGKVLWQYDAGDPIRSSPVVGKATAGEDRDIIYFGCSNGRLYAINSDTGQKRWAFDTTEWNIPELKDRNDLNGSPALGQNGIYIGGEHGILTFVPYDYPLSDYGRSDPRCSYGGNGEFDDDIKAIYFVTPGGSTEAEIPCRTISAATTITTRLVVREGGSTVDAGLYSFPLFDIYPVENIIKIWPEIDFTAELSADGHYIHINPSGFLEPSTEYSISFDGFYMSMGLHIGNIEIGGTRFGRIEDNLKFNTSDIQSNFPLSVGDNEVSSLEMRRLAVPFPSMMTSLNQIGFDSYHWIWGVLDKTESDEMGRGRFIIWSIGGIYNGSGELVPDAGTEFTFPLNGKYMNDFFILENRGLVFNVSDVRIPFELFQLKGQFANSNSVKPGASVYAEVSPFSDPYYGPLLAIGGLVNKNAKMVAGGTFLTDKFSGNANKRPEGIRLTGINYSKPLILKNGHVEACFNVQQPNSWNPDQHLASIVLVDSDRHEAMNINYRKLTSYRKDLNGNLSFIRLEIPAGTILPENLTAYVVLDVFPFYKQVLK